MLHSLAFLEQCFCSEISALTLIQNRVDEGAGVTRFPSMGI